MSKYLNVFNTLAEYQAFSASTEYVQPNVALVKETNVLYYDYGNNKPQADMSDFKLETEETSVGGDKYGIDAITKVNYIPSRLTSLKSAFIGFRSIVNSPEIPSGVTSLNSTFQGCSSLVNAKDIPSGVTNMDFTFSHCSSLVKAPTIPSGVTRIGYTFQYCTSLKELTLLQTTPPTYRDTLKGCSSLETIYVPDESVDAYKTATGWSEFADKFKPLSSKPTK